MPIVFTPSRGMVIDNTRPNVGGSYETVIPTAWPLDDPDLIEDVDYFNMQFWSGSLGEITIDQVIRTERADSTTQYAFDGDGLLVPFEHDTARCTLGEGLWTETSVNQSVDRNDDISSVSWTKANITVASDVASPYAAGTPAGQSIVGSDPVSTIKQTVALGGVNAERIVHAMFYKPVGATYTDPIELTQDNFTTVVDVRSQLVEGRWVQCYGPIQTASTDRVVGVRTTNANSKVGMHALCLERNDTMSTPIITTGTATVLRHSDINYQIMENFPSIWDLDEFTVIVVCKPNMAPMPDPEDVPGFTAFELNNAYTITADGDGQILPGASPGVDPDVMTITAYRSGAYAVGDSIVLGTGAASRTVILSQTSGTPGQLGTYNVQSDVTFPQTTSAGITLKARLTDAQGYGLNAANKGAPTYDRQTGITITNELVLPFPPGENYGFDPQNAQFNGNAVNVLAFTMNKGTLSSLSVLNGDVEFSDPTLLTAAPELNSSALITWGCAGPNGIGPLQNGTTLRGIILSRAMASAQLSNLALRLWLEATA